MADLPTQPHVPDVDETGVTREQHDRELEEWRDRVLDWPA